MSEDTKQITFEGREYTVPVWVEWVAVDSDGELCGYDLKAVISDGCFYPPDDGKWIFISNTTSWRDSLTKV